MLAKGNNIDFFVRTDNLSPPVVTLGDNDGFPFVRDVYARARDFGGPKKGVHVTIRFEGPARGNKIAVNIFQPADEDKARAPEPVP